MRWCHALIAATLLRASVPAHADEDAVCADRPGKATGTCTVPSGAWQIESGVADWSLQRTAGRRDTTLVLGESVIKYGIATRTDVGVDITPYVRVASHGQGVSESAAGIGDLAIQVKRRLTDDGAPLQFAVLPIVTIPLAKRDVGGGAWQFGMLLPIGYAIPRSALSIALTPEIDWVRDGDGYGRHLAMAQVAGLNWQASDRLTLSGELWGMWDWDPAGTTRQTSVDGSVAYLFNRRVQIDAGVNLGLNRQTPDVVVYGGFSIRL